MPSDQSFIDAVATSLFFCIISTKMKYLFLVSGLLLTTITGAQTLTKTQQFAAVNITQLSPRPVAVANTATPLVSLNGEWQFSTDAPFSKKNKIDVPGEWVMQGYNVQEGETAVYEREIEIPSDWSGKVIKLRFDAVSSWARVVVNGITVTEHEGGFVPFEADITNAAKAGKNTLTVYVQANTISDRLGCVSQYAVHTVGGILRKVTMFALPQQHITRLELNTTLTDNFTNGVLHINYQLSALQQKATVKYSLTDKNGKIVYSKEYALNDASGTHSLNVGKVNTWNAESPNLYTLLAELRYNQKTTETIQQSVGFREISVANSRVYINGRPVKLRGVNRHETHPLRGRSLTPTLCRQDAELFKAANCNYIRTSHYPPSEEFLQAADELGLMVESESAICWINHGASPIWKKWNYLDEQYLPYFVRANLENIQAGRNHPSVIIWSMANESNWSPLWEKVKTVDKAYDSTRPISFHDQCWGGFNNKGSNTDIANYHYPGTNGGHASDTMKRPVLFGEYAHLSCYNRLELETDPGIRSAYGAPLVTMYDSMYAHPNNLGGAIWSGIDDEFHLPDGRLVGYGPWGPIDGWRRPKPEYYGMKRAYAPVVIERPDSPVIKNGSLALIIQNRFDFTDLRGLQVECKLDGKPYTLNISLQPHGRKEILIPAPIREAYIAFKDAWGNAVNDEIITIKTTEDEITPTNHQPNIVEMEQAYRIQTDSIVYLINKTTGILTAQKAGRDVLLQGPVMCIVPANDDDGGKPNVAGETFQNNIHPLKSYPLYTLFSIVAAPEKSNGQIVLKQQATYTNGTGNLTYRFSTDGKVTIEYDVIYNGSDINTRQYGMLFKLPAGFDELSWQRKGSFTTYSDKDISRNKGTAKLNAHWMPSVRDVGKQPAPDWKDDANEMGSNDFRATRRFIYRAQLNDANGNTLKIFSNAKQSERAWLQDNQIHLLIADYSNAGSEPFYSSPFTDGKLKINKGKHLTGKLTFQIK